MKCLVTGASSGIGKDMARYLSDLGHHVIMVSKSEERLRKASEEVNNSSFFVADLTYEKDVDKLCDFILKEKPQIVINNAGFGAFGFYNAGLMPGGPMLSTYYATKSYVRSYTLGIYKELSYLRKNIHVAVLCPGPVDTNFNNIAGGNFSVKALSSEYVAKYAIDKLLKNKMLIVPGFTMKCGVFLSRFVPTKLVLNIAFKIQHKKRSY